MNNWGWWKRAGGVLFLCITAAVMLPAQTLTTLYSFDVTDGASPAAGAVQAADGNFYGTTWTGGANGAGTVYKITAGGKLTTVYSFCSQTDCTDGANPQAGLIQATDRNLYGTTLAGGASYDGAIFKISPSGTLTTLYSFCSQADCEDGSNPQAGLLEATDGDFYGTTSAGGANESGTVYKITPRGTLTTLYSFCPESNCANGAIPEAGLVQAANGDLYGTTSEGGSNGGGTVFKITSKGLLTTLYSFCSQSECTDGAYPQAGLVQATDGDLYGTTAGGGTDRIGTIFKITPSGTLTTLSSFDDTDGWGPEGALIRATDGNLYGTTSAGGGTDRSGTVFRINPTGTLTTLYSFCSQTDCADGSLPEAGLFQGTDGSMYGTTALGGAGSACSHDGCGTVFSLSVGLRPLVIAQPSSGKVGTSVTILGTNLTGASSVTFNGTPATFTLRSRTFITATVPASATSGTVQVVTPAGVLSSNAPFRVVP